MTKVTLKCDSVAEEFSLAELSALIKGVNVGLIYMYKQPHEFTDGEEDILRDIRHRLIDFYDDITPDDLPF